MKNIWICKSFSFQNLTTTDDCENRQTLNKHHSAQWNSNIQVTQQYSKHIFEWREDQIKLSLRSISKAPAQIASCLFKKKTQSRLYQPRRLIYRLIEVQDEAEEERVAALELKAHRGQSTHKVHQLHHWVLEPRQSHVSETEGRAE